MLQESCDGQVLCLFGADPNLLDTKANMSAAQCTMGAPSGITRAREFDG